MTLDEFLNRAARLRGQKLITSARKAVFRIRVEGRRLEVIPASTNRPRMVPGSRISRFLDEYNRSHMGRPGHYQEITFDASYLLAILSRTEEEGT